jgi:hypothetical protein
MIFICYITEYTLSNILFCEIAVYRCNLCTGVCEATFGLFVLNFWSHSELYNVTLDFKSLVCSVLHYRRKKIEFLYHVQSTGRINFSRFTTEFLGGGEEGGDGYVWVADRIRYMLSSLSPFQRQMQMKFCRNHTFNVRLQGRLHSICSGRSQETTSSNLGRVRNIILPLVYSDRLCGLVVRVPGYRSWGPELNFRRWQIFWEVVGLERVHSASWG